MVRKAVNTGGTTFSKPLEEKPQDQSWMYGAGFTDLDGHCWNVLYMDMSKMPKA